MEEYCNEFGLSLTIIMNAELTYACMMAYSLFMLKIIFFAFYVLYFFLKQFYVHYLVVWHYGDLGYS